MKILRSVIRRGFNVGTAGYFAVLKPNTWFAASRFLDRFPNLHERVEAAARQTAQGQENLSRLSDQPTVHLDLKPPPEPLHLVRLALIILVAAGITVFLLWWLFIRPHTLEPIILPPQTS